MLSIESERVISLNDATAVFPKRRRGRKPNVSTLYRWAQTGCRGVKLETIQVGCTKCTSREAIQRFCEQLTSAASAAAPLPGTKDSHEKADGDLRKAGW